MDNIADFLFLHRARSLPADQFADLLDELSWALDEESIKQITEARRRWLEGDDMEKAHIALLMSDSFPYNTRERLFEVLNQVRRNWPQLEEACTKMLSSWDESYKTEGTS